MGPVFLYLSSLEDEEKYNFPALGKKGEWTDGVCIYNEIIVQGKENDLAVCLCMRPHRALTFYHLKMFQDRGDCLLSTIIGNTALCLKECGPMHVYSELSLTEFNGVYSQ